MEIRKEEPKIHCTCCDRLLTEFEATRRNANTFQFLDLCKVCFEDVKTIIPTIDRRELMTEQDFDTDPDDDLDTEVSLEDFDMHISYVVDSEESWE